jgi:hypothetical protein
MVPTDKTAKLRIDGIIWGSPYIEVIDSNAIQASTGFSALVSAIIWLSDTILMTDRLQG